MTGTESELWEELCEIIIVARLDGSDHLIDGRRRINFWKREGLPWERRVLVIEPAP